uniref:Taste receptor type 2 n=1 Tax=Pyxicephalus adspersus TaxID=30357 RepID=A0AAV3AU01_PYXAD|nr:TPA: hypothetical protein GDO54_009888 [Pyxicephalus adspersus]
MDNFTWGKCDFPATVDMWVSNTTVGIFILATISLQLFIVIVNVIDWLKGRSLTAADQIITSIGITRIIFSVCSPFYYFTYYCTAELRVIFLVLNLVFGITSFFASIWLSSLLSILFCFKISTFRNVFFSRLKTILSQRVLFLIFASVLMAFGYTVMFCLVVTHKLFGSSGNYDFLFYNQNFQLIISMHILGNIFPIITCFASSVILIISLGFHIRQMKTHRNMLSVLHSISLIYVTTKLKNQFFRIIHGKMDCLFRRKACEPDTSRPLEMIPL